MEETEARGLGTGLMSGRVHDPSSCPIVAAQGSHALAGVTLNLDQSGTFREIMLFLL